MHEIEIEKKTALLELEDEKSIIKVFINTLTGYKISLGFQRTFQIG
jgi:hypothetical protein